MSTTPHPPPHPANGGGTRAMLFSFPSDQEDPVMASDPLLSDMALRILQQRSQKTRAPLGGSRGQVHNTARGGGPDLIRSLDRWDC